MADESSCWGKIILASGVFTWFHFIEGGLPPNCWALRQLQKVISVNPVNIILNKNIFIFC
jgi:hypothetical protein